MSLTDEINLENLRYAIYVRKSTDEDGKQVRSINDQISDCMKLVDSQKLKVIGKPIEERKSAKKPNQRPEFKQLLRDVKEGKIDGIISWHPDRLARNMIEAGKVIDMLDTGVIKDLKFFSHQFSNDANGKMLLGMLFVFAKHYSDDLSAKVTRGVHGNLSEGKSGGTPKHGYIRGENGLYAKDGHHFKLMQDAWYMRADGQSLDVIADYLNTQGYARYFKKNKSRSEKPITISILDYVFRDTFYFGMLNQSNQTVDLLELQPTFEPMIDQDIFYKAQQFSTSFKRGANKKHQLFLPLKRMVYCNICNKQMVANRPRGRLNIHYLYYTCTNKLCTRQPKNVRGKLVFDELQEIVDTYLGKLSYSAYESYLKEVKSLTAKQKETTRGELSTYRTLKAGCEKERTSLILSISRLQDKGAIEDANQMICELGVRIDDYRDKINKNSELLEKAKLPILSKEEFIDLIQLTGKKLKAGDKFQKDIIIRNLFSKLYLDNKKVAHYLWKEPFLSLVKATDLQSGGGGWS